MTRTQFFDERVSIVMTAHQDADVTEFDRPRFVVRAWLRRDLSVVEQCLNVINDIDRYRLADWVGVFAIGVGQEAELQWRSPAGQPRNSVRIRSGDWNVRNVLVTKSDVAQLRIQRLDQRPIRAVVRCHLPLRH